MCRDAFNEMTARNRKNNTSNRPKKKKERVENIALLLFAFHFEAKNLVVDLSEFDVNCSREFRNINSSETATLMVVVATAQDDA